MIRLTRQTDYGIVLLTQFVGRTPATHTARELAADTRLPLPMVSKILKLLARDGLLVSHRGVKGGYELARAPEAISVADVIGILEGPIAMTECAGESAECCEHEPFCAVSGNWQAINQAVRVALESLTLADMARPMGAGLVHLSKAPRPAGPEPAPPTQPPTMETT